MSTSLLYFILNCRKIYWKAVQSSRGRQNGKKYSRKQRQSCIAGLSDECTFIELHVLTSWHTTTASHSHSRCTSTTARHTCLRFFALSILDSFVHRKDETCCLHSCCNSICLDQCWFPYESFKVVCNRLIIDINAVPGATCTSI